MEAEFVASSEMARKILGLREMLSEIGIATTVPMKLRVDNQAAISQTEFKALSLKAKHVGVRFKLLCNFTRCDVTATSYLRSELMLADLMTKALDVMRLAALCGIMRVE